MGVAIDLPLSGEPLDYPAEGANFRHQIKAHSECATFFAQF
jgi:hypothetical protein